LIFGERDREKDGRSIAPERPFLVSGSCCFGFGSVALRLPARQSGEQFAFASAPTAPNLEHRQQAALAQIKNSRFGYPDKLRDCPAAVEHVGSERCVTGVFPPSGLFRHVNFLEGLTTLPTPFQIH
jgi:hypothetical protein